MVDEAKTERKVDEKEHQIQHKEELPKGGRHMPERVGVVVFAALGMIAGYASYVVNWPPYAIMFGIAIAFAAWLVLKKVLKLVEPKKWWINKIMLYILMWLVVWTILFNVLIVKAL